MRNSVLQNGKTVYVFLLVAGLYMLPITSTASDLNSCMTEMIHQISDSMTIGELRFECEKQVQTGTYPEEEKQVSAVSERLRQDKSHVLKPFTLMAHKPNYLIVAAYNTYGYNSEVFQEQTGDSSLELKDTEAQLQLSVKFPLAVNLFNAVDLYAAYTNRSFWQVYNSDISAPFRETNHEPEGWVQF